LGDDLQREPHLEPFRERQRIISNRDHVLDINHQRRYRASEIARSYQQAFLAQKEDQHSPFTFAVELLDLSRSEKATSRQRPSGLCCLQRICDNTISFHLAH
jgi:hypothetical protein